MFKFYSKGCEYVLWALVHIPEDQELGNFSAKDICRKAKVPEASTRKSLQALVRAGIMEAVSGPQGGYKLARLSREIPLLDIIKIVDGENFSNHCVMGFPRCNEKHPCPLHETWKILKGHMIEKMHSATLHDLRNAFKDKKLLST